MSSATLAAPPVVRLDESKHASLEALADPYPAFNQMAEAGPVVAVPRRGLTFYHVTGYANAMAVLNDTRFSKEQEHLAAAVAASGGAPAEAGFVLSGSGQRNLLNSDPPDHTRLRKLVNPAFSPVRIKALEPLIASQIEVQLDGLAGRDEACLISDYTYPIAIGMICTILGVPADDRDNFRVWATAASTPHVVPDAAIGQAEGANLLKNYLTDLIRSVRARVLAGKAGDDLLSVMAQIQEEGDKLSDEELAAMAFLLLIAGHETTVGLIAATLLRLGREVTQRSVLLERPELMETAIEEFLRMDGPVLRTTFRVATEDVEVAGFLIPKGGITTVALPTANRDPERIDEPDKFDVTRTGRSNLAFGYGAHFCLGRILARTETKLAVGAFLKAYPDYVPGEPVWAKTVIRAPLALPAKLGPRSRT